MRVTECACFRCARRNRRNGGCPRSLHQGLRALDRSLRSRRGLRQGRLQRLRLPTQLAQQADQVRVQRELPSLEELLDLVAVEGECQNLGYM